MLSFSFYSIFTSLIKLGVSTIKHIQNIKKLGTLILKWINFKVCWWNNSDYIENVLWNKYLCLTSLTQHNIVFFSTHNTRGCTTDINMIIHSSSRVLHESKSEKEFHMEFKNYEFQCSNLSTTDITVISYYFMLLLLDVMHGIIFKYK